MQISVEVSELKRNQILEPALNAYENQPIEQNLMDGTLTDEDIVFSEGRNEVDEHAYQIEKTGKFDIEASDSEQIAGVVRSDHSVEFSQGSVFSSK